MTLDGNIPDSALGLLSVCSTDWVLAKPTHGFDVSSRWPGYPHGQMCEPVQQVVLVAKPDEQVGHKRSSIALHLPTLYTQTQESAKKAERLQPPEAYSPTILTGSRGRSFTPVGTASILRTLSMLCPSLTTRPKTTCLPSKKCVSTVVMKNCQTENTASVSLRHPPRG